MEEQSASAQEMTAGMDNVARTSQEIADQVGSITQSMDEQGRVSQSISEAAEELVQLSGEMQKSVAQFKLKKEMEDMKDMEGPEKLEESEERAGLLPA